MNVNEQITSLLALRVKHLDAMTALSTAVAEGDEIRAFTAEEQTAFDADKAKIDAIDAKLVNLRAIEAAQANAAQPAPAPAGATAAPAPPPTTTALRATPGTGVKAFVPFAGQGFVRMALAVARTKGNASGAAEYASRWRDQTPEVEAVLRAIASTGELPGDVLRAAQAAGTTGGSTWAGPLVYAQNLASEFIELLRPMTIIGRLPLRPVPFNVSIPRQTAGVAAGWVGEGLSKPVGVLAFDRVTLPWAKVAIIAVITQELARLSDPSAEMLVRDDLAAAIVKYLDEQFVDPAVAVSAGLRPGSVTNGVTPIASSGPSVAQVNADLTAAIKAMAAANMPMTSPRWLMNAAARITLENLMTTQDQKAFPEVGNMMLKGYPIIESNAIATVDATPDTTNIILGDWSQVLHAADNVIDLSSSSEASLQMDSAPASPPTPLVSLWQQNMLGIKAEQYQYWVKRYANCVTYISGFQV